jgi:AcrR family transcriptional regulator
VNPPVASHPQRADAARNRAQVLTVAERLFAERGATAVSMEEIARVAGVGKGTVYRRFPDRAALAVALLAEHEEQLRHRVRHGPPPLGPGAPPAARLGAFYAAVVELLERDVELHRAAQTGSARYRSAAYAWWRVHVHTLLAEAGRDDPEDVLAELLLAPLAVDLYQHLRSRGVAPTRLGAALAALAHSTLG